MSSTIGVELKGGMYTFMSLKLHTSDVDIVDQKLADKVQQAPGFFKDTPVVIDLSLLEDLDADINAVALLDCIKRHQLIPIVASIGNKSSPLAKSIAIPLIESNARRSGSTKTVANSPEVKANTGTDGTAAHDSTAGDFKPTRAEKLDSSLDVSPDVELGLSREVEYVIKAPLLIDKPIRSGQQVYARDTDLIVMGQIGPGAEVIADNNIHIYGPLRGRALCGVSGNTSTRIFCQSLEAELVSVAGNYRMLETIPEELRGKPAQIWLDKDRLNIEPL